MSGAPTSTEPNPTQVRRLAGEFVKEYYRTLNANPDNLATFYHEDSSYSRLDEAGQDCVAATVVGQAKIGAKIKANGFRIPAIDSVDFQASANGAVVLMVQGTVEITSEQTQRKFAQTFVLLPATDALGLQLYYVRNDILHLLQPVNLVEQTPQVILQPVPTQQPAEPAVESKTPAPQAQGATSGAATTATANTTGGSGSPARPKKEKKSSRPKSGQQQQQQQADTKAATSADNATTAAAPTETKAAPVSDKPAETAPPTALPKRDNTARKQRPRSSGKKPGDGNAAASADNAPATEPAANKAPAKVSSWASLAGGSAAPSATTATTGSVAAQPKRPARAKKATVQAPATEGEQKDANTETKKDNANSNANTAAGSPRPSTAGGKGQQSQGQNQPQTPRANGQSVEKRPFIFVKDLGGAQKKDLEDLFKQYGTVTMVSLPPKRHYALVYFADVATRDKVLAQPSFRVKDHELSVEMGRPSKPDHSGRQQNQGNQGQGQQGGEHRRAKSTSSNRGAPRVRPPRSFVAGSGVVSGDDSKAATNGGGHNRQPSKAANGPKTALGSPTNKNSANAGNNA